MTLILAMLSSSLITERFQNTQFKLAELETQVEIGQAFVDRLLAAHVRGDEIVARQMWTLSLAFDHRLVDGAPAARFLQRIKQYIENPYLLLG